MILVSFTEGSSEEAIRALVGLLRASNKYPKGVARAIPGLDLKAIDVVVTREAISADHFFDIRHEDPRLAHSTVERAARDAGLI